MHSSTPGAAERMVLRSFCSAARLSASIGARYSSMVAGFGAVLGFARMALEGSTHRRNSRRLAYGWRGAPVFLYHSAPPQLRRKESPNDCDVRHCAHGCASPAMQGTSRGIRQGTPVLPGGLRRAQAAGYL